MGLKICSEIADELLLAPIIVLKSWNNLVNEV